MRCSLIVLALVFTLLFASSAITKTVPPPRPKADVEERTEGVRVSRAASALPDTFILADFDFEDGLGGPDAQGWTSVDKTEPMELHFHVDDFATVGGPYAPLSGTKSLWCGAADFTGCAACPGYGNGWTEYFESVAFPSSGNVTIDFLIEHDSEPIYDFTYVEYLSKSAVWQTLDSFNGIGSQLASVVVPADSLAGSVKLRFRFQSDLLASDEDGLYASNGAVVLDSITVTDNTGVLDFQDFESETLGAMATADGDWMASTYTPFGDYAGLFDGSTVLQEDSFVVNNTHLWGFFNGSTYDYSCGGHPEQLAVPYADDPESLVPTDFLDNEIRSPFIDLSQDENGTPVASGLSGLVFEFDVYRDLPLDNLVFYTFGVRYLVDGEPTPWDRSNQLFHSPTSDPDWHRQVEDISYTYIQGATHVQIAISCVDGKLIVPQFGTGDCHTHAPLIDNVVVTTTIAAPIIVTNANDSGAGSLRQAMLDAQASPDRSEIRFDIPGAAPHVITLQTDLPLPYDPVVIDATTQPDYSGTPTVVIDGGAVAGLRGPHLYSNSALRGFEIRNFEWEGARVTGHNNQVQSNYIHDNGYTGLVMASSARDNLAGGATSDLGNTITGNQGSGIHIESSNSEFNSILNNSISGNQGLGIDLRSFSNLDGVTANDVQDPDAGPNGFQNFPELRWADSGSSSIGGSLNSTPKRTFLVQLFANAACDASGYGEGETYLGSTEVTTDANGDVDFAVITGVPFADGDFLTATATAEDGSTSEFSQCLEVSPATAIEGEGTPVAQPALYAAMPNPFNPTTIIRYDVPSPGAHVRIVVYDVTGRRVATLVDGQKSGGQKRVTWNGRNDRGNEVATGVYFYRMTVPGFTQTRKMVLVK